MYFTKLVSEAVHCLTDQMYPEKCTSSLKPDTRFFCSPKPISLALGHIQTPTQ